MRKALAVIAAGLMFACSDETSQAALPPDRNEPNDSPATATSIGLLGAPVFATLATSSDVDYYELTVDQWGATVWVEAIYEPDDGRACIDMYDGTENLLRDGCSSDVPWYSRDDFGIQLYEGTCYVAVRWLGNGEPFEPFAYTLKVVRSR